MGSPGGYRRHGEAAETARRGETREMGSPGGYRRHGEAAETARRGETREGARRAGERPCPRRRDEGAQRAHRPRNNAVRQDDRPLNTRGRAPRTATARGRTVPCYEGFWTAPDLRGAVGRRRGGLSGRSGHLAACAGSRRARPRRHRVRPCGVPGAVRELPRRDGGRDRRRRPAQRPPAPRRHRPGPDRGHPERHPRHRHAGVRARRGGDGRHRRLSPEHDLGGRRGDAGRRGARSRALRGQWARASTATASGGAAPGRQRT